MQQPLVLYDGVCGLCNRMVQFLLKRDKQDRLRFASLQSEIAAAVLTRHAMNPADLDTVCMVEHYEERSERVLVRSDAVLAATVALGGFWRIATLGKIIPRGVRDYFYRFVARNRYRVFGKYDTCMLPEPRHRAKFLDMT